ncbi:unnamed protein product [Hymenolepis diminuta]|uniref:Transmembrane protein n=1 Tax=Hymenolepis diminuta TaxID=6216 RepID=A0A0R3SQF5_HYMDI|nr:unnamed protein product [Hymenolepis diminuta]
MPSCRSGFASLEVFFVAIAIAVLAANSSIWQSCNDDLLRKIGILGVTAFGISRIIGERRVGPLDRWMIGHFQSSSRFESAKRLLDFEFPDQEEQKSESNLSMARRSKTKNENETSELVFSERTKSETSAKSVDDTYMIVKIFIFTYGHVEERTVVTNDRN